MIMTQEEKDLLLKDLCARLPYGVKLHCYSNAMVCIGPYTLDTIVLDRIFNEDTEYVPFDEVKPYLFPLSSMTKEQKKELENLGWYFDNFEINNVNECLGTYKEFVTHSDCFILIDWCYKNHFDINNLIPMGLANDSTGLNIY